MTDKETDLHKTNTPPRTHTVTLYKQELWKATEAENTVNSFSHKNGQFNYFFTL